MLAQGAGWAFGPLHLAYAINGLYSTLSQECLLTLSHLLRPDLICTGPGMLHLGASASLDKAWTTSACPMISAFALRHVCTAARVSVGNAQSMKYLQPSADLWCWLTSMH